MHSRSILVLTRERALMFTAPDAEHHDQWLRALRFIARPNNGLTEHRADNTRTSLADGHTAAFAQPEEQYDHNRGRLLSQIIPATDHGAPPDLSLEEELGGAGFDAVHRASRSRSWSVVRRSGSTPCISLRRNLAHKGEEWLMTSGPSQQGSLTNMSKASKPASLRSSERGSAYNISRSVTTHSEYGNGYESGNTMRMKAFVDPTHRQKKRSPSSTFRCREKHRQPQEHLHGLQTVSAANA